MSNHTPGPWEVIDYTDYEDNGLSITQRRGDRNIGAIRWQDKAIDDEDRANARLIAEAPTMFDLLKTAVELRAFEESTKSGAVVNWPKWFEEARAAIAKVEGE